MAKAMTLVGLDVHARQTHAAVLDPASGEIVVRKLRIAPEEVASFLEGLGAGVRAVYEAGPTGFGLARAARERGIDVRVAAPGSIPNGAGDRVKTDRRDALRLARLLAAGELSFAFVPSTEQERFRDLVRCIEDARSDLMRARHRLSKLLLRRGERYPGPGGAWTARHMTWLRSRVFEDPCSQATFVDYLAAVELLAGRRATLIAALEQTIPDSRHAPVIARLRCFRGIDTLSAAGLCAELGDFRRFQRPKPLSGFLGIVPSERTSDQKRRQGSRGCEPSWVRWRLRLGRERLAQSAALLTERRLALRSTRIQGRVSGQVMALGSGRGAASLLRLLPDPVGLRPRPERPPLPRGSTRGRGCRG